MEDAHFIFLLSETRSSQIDVFRFYYTSLYSRTGLYSRAELYSRADYTAVRIIQPCRKNSSVFLSGKYGIIPESRALSATKISLAVCPLSENALSNAPGLSVGRFFIFRIRPILFRFKTVPERRRKPRDFALDMSKNICYTFTDRKNISRKTRFRKTAPKIICRNPMVPSGFSAESVRKIL